MSARRRPPRLARWLLRRWLPADMRGPVVGDLEEVFRRQMIARGSLRAHFAYWKEALALLARLALERPRGPGRPRPGRSGRPSMLDVRLGLRRLRAQPGLTVVGGLGLAVTIAIGVGYFAVAQGFLYPTLPLEEGDRLVGLENWDTIVNNEERQALHDFHAWRAGMRTVVEISAFRDVARNLIVEDGSVQPLLVAEMTASGFDVARVPPALGRTLVPDDERPGAAPVVVIGHDVWQSRFGGDPGVLGTRLRLGDAEHTVVGVMPQDFRFPMRHHYWIPLRADPADWERGQGPAIFVFGRLAPEVTREQAQAELAAIGARAAEAWPETHGHLRPRVLPYTYPLVDIQNMTIWDFAAMQLLASFLFVVVALNVGVLSYARTATRRGEIAVRAALGASRARIVLQLFVEALVLAALAAVAGVAIAQLGLRLANRLLEQEFGNVPFWGAFGVSWAALPYVVALTVTAAVIVGVVPGLQATGRRMRATLAQLGGATGLRLGNTWTTLIVLQVAIAVCGLSGAVNLGWDAFEATLTAPGFPAERILATRLSLEHDDVDPASEAVQDRLVAMQAELLRRLEDEAGFVRTVAAERPPGGERPARIEVEGMPSPEGAASGFPVAAGAIARGYFATLEAPILAGRPFGREDLRPDARSVIVNRAFARQVLGSDSALGHRVRYLPPPGGAQAAELDHRTWYEIVGVAENLYLNPLDPLEVDPVLYHPMADAGVSGAFLISSIGGDTESAVRTVRSVAASIDPTVFVGMRQIADSDHQATTALRLGALVLVSVTASVLLLSGAGVYALMSLAVTRQRREIGIRRALGAPPRSILRAIFLRAAVQLLAGVGIGLALAIALGTLEDGMGRVLTPAVGVLVVAGGLLAAFGPARRGLRVDATEALRAE